jgi:hypothetical protein
MEGGVLTTTRTSPQEKVRLRLTDYELERSRLLREGDELHARAQAATDDEWPAIQQADEDLNRRLEANERRGDEVRRLAAWVGLDPANIRKLTPGEQRQAAQARRVRRALGLRQWHQVPPIAQDVPRARERRQVPAEREGHGRPRSANAPPSDDPDPDHDPEDVDGWTVIARLIDRQRERQRHHAHDELSHRQRLAARRMFVFAGWRPQPLTVRRYQAAWMRARTGAR